ncbi:MAG: 3-oxoacyl-[acyl-carrier-protein] reductase [Clostridiales Family XIII bacterium]|nr:3-oxoacyl-[acyl-carrier-protein] reductase [Clostridiales Family XIII bacterium]
MFNGKTIIVTGGTRGIGKAIAMAFARQHANIVLTYAGNEDTANQTRDELEKITNDNFIIVKSNVSDIDSCDKVIKMSEKKFGKETTYGLINNAGITRDKLLLRMSQKDFKDVLDANLVGSFNMIKAITPKLTKNRAGRIINLSSVVGLRGNAGQVNYSASKAGIIGLTLSVAKELGGRGITVNAIAPGMIETDMTSVLTNIQKDNILNSISLRKIGKPEDVANLAVFLASNSASYITGQVISVDGGMSI